MLSISKKGLGGQDCWDSRAEESAIESRKLRLSLDRVRLRCPVVRRGLAGKIAGIRAQRRVECRDTEKCAYSDRYQARLRRPLPIRRSGMQAVSRNAFA